MKDTVNYLKETIGLDAREYPASNKLLHNLPIYITQSYRLYEGSIFDRQIIFAEQIEDHYSVLQIKKHLKAIRNRTEKPVILLLKHIQSYNRKRFIENRINFIVPYKQIFLPELLINLSENYHTEKIYKNKSLMPSSQFLLLFHLIHNDNKWKLEEQPFKEIANRLKYSSMAISNAVDELKNHNLLEVIGDKEKFIKFNFQKKALWNLVQELELLDSPVLKTVYTDRLPVDEFTLKAGITALSEYTNLNPDSQQCYAIERSRFNEINKRNTFNNNDDMDGKFAIEVWKYEPKILSNEFKINNNAVDPLSLYLSIKNNYDERIEMAMEQLIEKIIW